MIVYQSFGTPFPLSALEPEVSFTELQAIDQRNLAVLKRLCLAKQAGFAAASHVPAYEEVQSEEEKLAIPRDGSDDFNFYLYPMFVS